MESNDGAVISIQYMGILGADRAPRTAPLFQTGDARYHWLNNVQAIAIGVAGTNEVTYEVYAVSWSLGCSLRRTRQQ